MHSATHQAIDAVWRIESAKIVAARGAHGARHRAGRRTGAGRAGGRARALAADGVPDNPGAWLMTTAKNRALDRLRRDKALDAKLRADRP